MLVELTMRWLKRLLNTGRVTGGADEPMTVVETKAGASSNDDQHAVRRLEYDRSQLGELTMPPLTWSSTTLDGCGLSLEFPQPLAIDTEHRPEGWVYRFGEMPSTLKDGKLYSPDPIVVFITVYNATVPDAELGIAIDLFKKKTERELPPGLVRIGEVHVQDLAGRPTIVDKQRFSNGTEIHSWSTICDHRPLRLGAYLFVVTPSDWRDAPLRMIQTLRRG